MKLSSFRVRKFRNVIDSGDIAVSDDVTCFVGKNEAGKSALMEALYLLNPAYDDEFSADAQYPKWLFARDRRDGDSREFKPITAKFTLDESDIEAIEALLGEGSLQSNEMRLWRAYSGTTTFSIDVDSTVAVEKAISDIGSDSGLPGVVSAATDLDELGAAVTTSLAGMQDDAPLAGRLQRLAASDLLSDGSSAEAQAYAAVSGAIPQFFHFTEYSTLPGRIKLTDLSTGDVDGGIRAARALVRLAGSDPDTLSADDYDERRNELDAVQIDLSRQVFEYWRQNSDLTVDIDVDKETVDTGTNQTAVASTLHIRVKDARTGYGNNFDQRSSGFQWFFSFLAAFSEFDDVDTPTIVLLDEPGLSLHGRAQDDYLRFIDERLAPTAQVLYTTHSPFMVRVGALDRVRLVEDRGPDDWSVVVQASGATDPDSLFPLQAALGYDIAQNLFVGPNNLVVEGLSEFYYLTVMSEVLSALDRTTLDPRLRLLPAGGSSNIPTFVSLIGPHLAVTVLTDSSSAPMQKLDNLVDAGNLNPERWVKVGDITGSSSADIEDLFSVDDYLALFNASLDADISVGELPEGSRIVERVERLRGDGFNHAAPASHLLTSSANATFSDETIENFEKLFGRLNDTVTETE